ncbi:hypothetical protein [Caudoviricetes sp.]|nr:hypothetical protein [Caudoviricetes sp.]
MELVNRGRNSPRESASRKLTYPVLPVLPSLLISTVYG